MPDKSLREISATANDIILKGFHYLQKFSCEKCSNRLTMDILDILFIEGECDKCGFVTNIEENGCGLVFVSDPTVFIESGTLRFPREDEIIAR